MRILHFAIILFISSLVHDLHAQKVYPKIYDLRAQAEITEKWLDIRLKTVAPELMKRENVDMWVISAREYNEDPVIETMLPATWMAARRRTILVIAKKGNEYDRLAVARYDVGIFFKKAWDPEKQPDQWKRLAEIIAEYKPNSIAVNMSEIWGHADGLTHSEYEGMMAALDKKTQKKVISAEKLAVGWLETRIPEEMEVYPQICRIGHEIIKEAFSNTVIQPGVTTTADVQWWMREKIRSLGLQTWFHPSVSIQRGDAEEHSGDFSSKPAADVIRHGDLLHCDFGVKYLGLNTDQQQHAYVLRPGETEAPSDLVNALAVGNRLQDIFTTNFKDGRTGNEVLKMTREMAIAEGITPSIYTHPIGYHGHAAGTTLGMWDKQNGVPGDGDYPLHKNTAYSIELNATVNVPMWKKDIRIMLEEEAYFTGENVWYIDGRQTELILID